jgi:hypothetical protein
VSLTVQPVSLRAVDPVFFSLIHSAFRLELPPVSLPGESKKIVSIRIAADQVAARESIASADTMPMMMRFKRKPPG